MALTDYVLMPRADYVAMCDKMREIKKTTNTFTSGQFVEEMASIKEGGTDAEAVYVSFMSHDGATELHKRAVFAGNDCMEVVSGGVIDAPTRESSNTEVYEFNGWALSPYGAANANALKNVTADRYVYAAYTAETRYYTVRFFDGDTLLNTLQVTYGGTADYTPTKEGYQFNGWQPSNVNITADTDCFAQWETKLTFANATWAQIAEISEAGEAADHFAVGDEKTVSITNGGTTENIIMQIAGFNHDDLSDGTGKAGISIVCKTVPTYQTMFATQSGLGDLQFTHAKCAVHNALQEQGAIWNMLPAQLLSVVKAVNKNTNISSSYVGQDAGTKTTPEKLWALSVDELGYTQVGTDNISILGSKYDLFPSKETIEVIQTASGSNAAYWTRTAYRHSTGGMAVISASVGRWGVNKVYYGNYYNTQQTYYIRFGFCV